MKYFGYDLNRVYLGPKTIESEPYFDNLAKNYFTRSEVRLWRKVLITRISVVTRFQRRRFASYRYRSVMELASFTPDQTSITIRHTTRNACTLGR